MEQIFYCFMVGESEKSVKNTNNRNKFFYKVQVCHFIMVFVLITVFLISKNRKSPHDSRLMIMILIKIFCILKINFFDFCFLHFFTQIKVDFLYLFFSYRSILALFSLPCHSLFGKSWSSSPSLWSSSSSEFLIFIDSNFCGFLFIGSSFWRRGFFRFSDHSKLCWRPKVLQTYFVSLHNHKWRSL